MPEAWSQPEGVVERRVDPPSGLILEEGCEPESGEAGTELFLAGEEPATVCPVGGDDGPGLLDRFGGWIAGVWRGASSWVAGLFEDEEDERPSREAVERALGTEPLPRRGEERPDSLEGKGEGTKDTLPPTLRDKKEREEMLEELEKDLEELELTPGRGRGEARGRGDEKREEGGGEGERGRGGGEGGGQGEERDTTTAGDTTAIIDTLAIVSGGRHD